jgi:hypothetical protein
MAFKIQPRAQYEDCFCGKINTPAPDRALVNDDHVTELFVGPKRRVGKGDYGGHILLCGKKKSYFPFHCMVGPDWPVVVIVFTLIIVIDIIVLPVIAALGWPVLLIGLVGFAGTLTSYAFVACSDPGIIYDPESERLLNLDSPRGNGNFADLESGPLVHHQQNSATEDEAAHAYGKVTAVSPPPSASELNPIAHGLGDADGNKNELPPLDTTGGLVDTVNSGSVVPNTATSPQQHIQYFNGMAINTMQCGHCEIMRPKTARHCNYCGVCIDHLDHHCPCKYHSVSRRTGAQQKLIFSISLTAGCGQCIGKNNIKAFNVFVSLVCFQIYFLGGSLFYYIISLFTSWPHGPKA